MKMSLKEFKNEIRNLKKGFYRNKYFYYFTLKYVLLSSLFLIGFKFIPPFANTLYLFNHILKTSDITPEFKLILIFANFYIFSIIINILNKK